MNNFVPADKHEPTDPIPVTTIPDSLDKTTISYEKNKVSPLLHHTGEGIDEFIALNDKEGYNGETNQDISGIKMTKGSKKKRIVTNALTILAILCFALGIYFLALPSIVHKNQDDAAQKLLEEVKKLSLIHI